LLVALLNKGPKPSDAEVKKQLRAQLTAKRIRQRAGALSETVEHFEQRQLPHQ
jgi:hypothetical protein